MWIISHLQTKRDRPRNAKIRTAKGMQQNEEVNVKRDRKMENMRGNKKITSIRRANPICLLLKRDSRRE